MKKEDLKRYIQFVLVVLAAGSIYPLVYLKTNYQNTILDVFHMQLSDLNSIYVVLGFTFIIGYFPSGWFADKFNSRTLLAFSLLVTGSAGIWFAQIPSVGTVKIIFFIWGISTVFTFWSAHMKAVKLLAKKNEEARFFGFLDGGRGVVEAVLASFALMIFSGILGKDTTNLVLERTALVKVIYMYSFVLIILAILIILFLKVKETKEDDSTDSTEKVEKLKTIPAMKAIMSNKLIWILGVIIFMCYIVTWTIYYLGGFLQTNIKVDAVTVGTITLIMLWMRPIGGISAGFLGDKFGKANVLRTVAFLGSFVLIVTSILPYSTNKTIFYVAIIFTSLMIYSIRGLYWSLLGDCGIKNNVAGMAIGFVSLIAYLPDVLVPIVNSYLFKHYGDNGGYNAYFIFSGIAGFVAILFIFIFVKVKKNQKVVIN